MMSYPSIVEVDYNFCILVKQQLNCFVIKINELINGMKIAVVYTHIGVDFKQTLYRHG